MTARRALLGQVERIHDLVGRQGSRVEAGEELDELLDRELRKERRRLELDADARLDPLRMPGHVLAEDGQASGVRRPEALEHLDRRRLAGPVRAEEPEDLAPPDLEADAIDSPDVAIRLAHVLDDDDRLGVRSRSIGRRQGRAGHRRPMLADRTWRGPIVDRGRVGFVSRRPGRWRSAAAGAG